MSVSGAVPEHRNSTLFDDRHARSKTDGPTASSVCRTSIARSAGTAAQLPPQNLADVCLRQTVAELDVLGALVGGEVLPAVRGEIVLRQRGVTLHSEQ